MEARTRWSEKSIVTKPNLSYEQFLQAKMVQAPSRGFEISADEVNPLLKPHQRDVVLWDVRLGCAANFLRFGLGKTVIQIETERLIQKRVGGESLTIAPLGVRQEFKHDVEMLRDAAADLGVTLKYIRRPEEIEAGGFHLTNYETVRDGKLDPRLFSIVSLDEAAVLRGFGGTKTFREFMRLFENGQIKYKFVNTATPDPNEYIELLAYAAFLDVMDVGQAKTRFFKRDSTKADTLTLHPHKEKEFWLWVSTWAMFLQKPSDLGYSDEGYELPETEINWHELATDHANAGYEVSGQGRLTRNVAMGLVGAAKEKRASMDLRIGKMMELRALDPPAHRIIWHDLEDERKAIEKEIPTCRTVYGNQDQDEREQYLVDFAAGKIQEMAGKPSMLGAGGNYQRHCSWAIFLGIGFKFNDFIQAIHRLVRYLQTKQVRIDLIYTEAERDVRRVLEEKWQRYNEQTARMSEIIREFGLASNALQQEMGRSMGIERQVVTGENFELANDDAIYDTRSRATDSAHLILTSIPFSMQYEYTPSFNDFGHTESNELFWQQMDYLTPELLRILQPGRVAAIHVKDRIVPGGLTGLGFQTVYEFHCDAIAHYKKHGFAFLGMKTIVTDVVRENNQTYRLGWTEQCKDGSRMGAGMPEYLLLFRKPQTNRLKGYADVPVVKNKAEYSRSRWQIDAHGFMRSSGNRILTAEDLRAVDHAAMFKLFRKYGLSEVYDFEHHVELGESLELCGFCNHVHLGLEGDDHGKVCAQVIDGVTCKCTRYESLLPATFMLLQPPSWSDEVWTDITRMLSLNSAQSAAGREMHLCPMQFDIADRVISQFTMPGETVYDPFGGLGTVPFRALKMGRKGIACELGPRYFNDAVYYCQKAEAEASVPTLFDLVIQPEAMEQEQPTA